jgi:hypothetical protein
MILEKLLTTYTADFKFNHFSKKKSRKKSGSLEGKQGDDDPPTSEREFQKSRFSLLRNMFSTILQFASLQIALRAPLSNFSAISEKDVDTKTFLVYRGVQKRQVLGSREDGENPSWPRRC